MVRPGLMGSTAALVRRKREIMMRKQNRHVQMGRVCRVMCVAGCALVLACSSSSNGSRSSDAGNEASLSDSGLAAACTAAGGTIASDLCCASAGDFPNTCLVGACGCAPTSSHMVQVCQCATGCWNGTECAPMGGTDASGSDGPPVTLDAPEELADSAGEDVTSDGSGSSADGGDAGDSGLAAACVAAGGTVSSSSCCTSASDFPNTCLIGACGCSPTNSHSVSTCDCGSAKCWNGATCAPMDQ